MSKHLPMPMMLHTCQPLSWQVCNMYVPQREGGREGGRERHLPYKWILTRYTSITTLHSHYNSPSTNYHHSTILLTLLLKNKHSMCVCANLTIRLTTLTVQHIYSEASVVYGR